MLRSVKLPLRDIVIDETVIDSINSIVYRCHKITTIAYQFIKLFVLKKYKQKEEIPAIDKQFVMAIFRTVTVKNTKRGKPAKETKLTLELKEFYNKEFKPLINNEKISSTNLTHILNDYLSVDIVKNYKNNIQLHFVLKS
jgi:hypothetical protein